MKVEHFFAALPVADLDGALSWYERFFGGPPAMRPNDQEAVWHVAGQASVYVVADQRRAGKALLTIIVADLDAALAELRERGLAAASTERPQFRKAVFRDPEGNQITLAQLGG